MAAEDELDVLAGRYALGTLTPDERSTVDDRLRNDGELARRIAAWRERLAPLDEDFVPVSAGPEVWQEISRSLDDPPNRGQDTPWWQRPSLWRGWAVTATAAAAGSVALAVVLATTGRAPGLVAVLDDPQGRPLWVVRAARDADSLIAAPLYEGAPPGLVPELWLLRDGQVISLALLKTSGSSARSVVGPARGELRVGDRLAVSIEPQGGSPTGRATGPVVSRGVLVPDPS